MRSGLLGLWVWTVAVTLGSTGAACSGAESSNGPRRGGTAGTFDNPMGGAGASGAGVAGIDNPIGMAGTQVALPPTGGGSGGDQCGGESFVAEGKKLEIVVLFDNSASMAIPFGGGGGNWMNAGTAWGGGPAGGGFGPTTPWDAAVIEMKTFVNAPEAAGISLAMKYFGQACEPTAYSTPDVPMAELATNAAVIGSSLDATRPTSQTATKPALEGGMAYVRERLASTGYNARIVLLLVTDGEPDQDDCTGNTLDGCAQVAADGFAAAMSVPTYVLSTASDIVLDQIAQAGGTGTAINADVSSPGGLANKLIEISQQELAELPCEYAMPAGYEAINDPDLVNLRHNGANVGRVDGAGACDPARGGWFYDNPGAPHQILTCAATCGVLKQGGAIDITLGCPVEPLPPVE